MSNAQFFLILATVWLASGVRKEVAFGTGIVALCFAIYVAWSGA